MGRRRRIRGESGVWIVNRQGAGRRARPSRASASACADSPSTVRTTSTRGLAPGELARPARAAIRCDLTLSRDPLLCFNWGCFGGRVAMRGWGRGGGGGPHISPSLESARAARRMTYKVGQFTLITFNHQLYSTAVTVAVA